MTAPSGDRFLLPLLPVAAAVVAAAIAELPTRARWSALGLIVIAGAWAIQPRREADLPDTIQARWMPDVTVTVPVAGLRFEALRDPAELALPGFTALMDAVEASCAAGCDVVVRGREDAWVQPRTFAAAAGLRGLTTARWWPSHLGEAPGRIGSGRRRLLLLQPCGLRHEPDRGSEREAVAAALGAAPSPIGRFALPGRCEMTLDALDDTPP